MIRPCRSEAPLFYVADELVSKSRTFYDRLSSLEIDWEALFSELRWAFCEGNGRPTDPVLYGKCFLVGYFEGIEEDVELAARVADSLSIRRFLFGSLSGPTPDHSSLSRVRRIVSERCDIDRILELTVELLRSKGMVAGEAVAMDTSLVPSRARLCFEEAPSKSAGQALATSPETIPEAPTQVAQIAESVCCEMDEVASSPKKPKRLERSVPSSYDPEAEVARKPGYKAHPSYKIGVATDYRQRAILAVDAYPASMGEGQTMRLLLSDLVRNSGEVPRHVVADAGMDDAAFHALAEFFGSTPVTSLQKNTSVASGFGKECFFYDEARDVFVCPAGQDLKRTRSIDAVESHYAASMATCLECPLKIACYGSRKTAKSVHRKCDDSSRERVIANCKDPTNRHLLAIRKAKVEPIFSDFKEQGGLSRIWTKGLECASVKAKFAGIGWNLKLLMKRHDSKVTAKTQPPEPKTRLAVDCIDGLCALYSFICQIAAVLAIPGQPNYAKEGFCS